MPSFLDKATPPGRHARESSATSASTNLRPKLRRASSRTRHYGGAPAGAGGAAVAKPKGDQKSFNKLILNAILKTHQTMRGTLVNSVGHAADQGIEPGGHAEADIATPRAVRQRPTVRLGVSVLQDALLVVTLTVECHEAKPVSKLLTKARNTVWRSTSTSARSQHHGADDAGAPSFWPIHILANSLPIPLLVNSSFDPFSSHTPPTTHAITHHPPTFHPTTGQKRNWPKEMAKRGIGQKRAIPTMQDETLDQQRNIAKESATQEEAQNMTQVTSTTAQTGGEGDGEDEELYFVEATPRK